MKLDLPAGLKPCGRDQLRFADDTTPVSLIPTTETVHLEEVKNLESRYQRNDLLLNVSTTNLIRSRRGITRTLLSTRPLRSGWTASGTSCRTSLKASILPQMTKRLPSKVLLYLDPDWEHPNLVWDQNPAEQTGSTVGGPLR